MAANLAVVANPELEGEAKALLTARLGLAKPALVGALKTAAQDAERAFLRSIGALTAAGAHAAAEKLLEEWKKVTAARDRLAEREKAVQDISALLDCRWDEIAAAQPSTTLQAHRESHCRTLKARSEEQGRALDFVRNEAQWCALKLKRFQEAAAAPGGEAKGPRKA
jgi:hypothetical protein